MSTPSETPQASVPVEGRRRRKWVAILVPLLLILAICCCLAGVLRYGKQALGKWWERLPFEYEGDIPAASGPSRMGDLEISRITSSGDGIWGPVLTIKATNPTDEELVVHFPPGFIFMPDNFREQRMMVIQDFSATVPAGEEAELRPYVICIDNDMDAPASGSTYTPGEMAEGELLQIAECISEQADLDSAPDSADMLGIQMAVWSTSSGLSVVEMAQEAQSREADEFGQAFGESAQGLESDEAAEGSLPPGSDAQAIEGPVQGLESDEAAEGSLPPGSDGQAIEGPVQGPESDEAAEGSLPPGGDGQAIEGPVQGLDGNQVGQGSLPPGDEGSVDQDEGGIGVFLGRLFGLGGGGESEEGSVDQAGESGGLGGLLGDLFDQGGGGESEEGSVGQAGESGGLGGLLGDLFDQGGGGESEEGSVGQAGDSGGQALGDLLGGFPGEGGSDGTAEDSEGLGSIIGGMFGGGLGDMMAVLQEQANIWLDRCEIEHNIGVP